MTSIQSKVSEIDSSDSYSNKPSAEENDEQKDEDEPYDYNLPTMLADVKPNPIDVEHDIFLSFIRFKSKPEEAE